MNKISPYLLILYPNKLKFMEILDLLVGQNIDMIELGIPFSEPQADGPILTQANNKVINNGINMSSIIQIIKEIKEKYPNLKITIMSYLNPLYQYGIDNFLDKIGDYIDYLLVPDLPVEEITLLPQNKISISTIIGDSMSEKEIQSSINQTTGFLYVMTNLSTTGKKINVDKQTDELIKKINKYNYKGLKKFAGFGIQNKEDTKKLLNLGFDGCIIGSKITDIYNKGGINALENYLKLF